MRVELFTEDGLVGEITLGQGDVCVGSNDLAARLMAETRVAAPGSPPVGVTPADGERYLRALPLTFRGPRFWAAFRSD